MPTVRSCAMCRVAGVSIATDPTGETIIDPAGGIEVPQVRNPVPSRYNRDSELTAEIVTGPNVVDFTLER